MSRAEEEEVERKMSEDANRTTHFLAARSVLPGVLALFLVFFAGCKKESAPVTVVTVQAAHPEQGPIAAHFTADAVLAPMAEAATTHALSFLPALAQSRSTSAATKVPIRLSQARAM